VRVWCSNRKESVGGREVLAFPTPEQFEAIPG
jgi:hypothetical protein